MINISKMVNVTTVCEAIYIQIFFCLLLGSFSAKAVTVDELIINNQLAVNAKIISHDLQIVGQPIILSVEVATVRWFVKGTTIDKLNLKDVVVLPNNELSINSTKKVDGITWTTQTREITLYPTRKGRFEIPEITLTVSVNTEKNGEVEGVVTTPALSFDISLPNELVKIDKFIVSPAVTVDLVGDISSEQEYAIGEAVTQTITITAKEVPAMMIPPLQIPPIEGVSIYQKPSKVVEQSNRGSLTGTRIETITYIFEQAGDYSIEEQQFYWWDITNNTLESIVIEPQKWTVAGNNLSANKSLLKGVLITKQQLFYLFALLLLLMFGYQIFKYKKPLVAYYIKRSHLEQRKLKKEFLTAVKQKNNLLAVNLLFQYFHLKNQALNNLRLVFANSSAHLLLLNKMYLRTFQCNDAKQASISLDEAKTLINFNPQKHQTKACIDNKICLNNE